MRYDRQLIFYFQKELCELRYIDIYQLRMAMDKSQQTLQWTSVKLQFPRMTKNESIAKWGYQQAQVNNRFFLLGGINGEKESLNDVWSVQFNRYEQSNANDNVCQFIQQNPMLSSRYWFGICVFQNIIFTIGGRQSQAGLVNSDCGIKACEEYDVMTGLSKQLPELNSASDSHTCFLSHSATLIFKYGGYRNEAACHLVKEMVEFLDLRYKQKWETLEIEFSVPSLNQYLSVSTFYTAILGTAVEDKFIVFGGSNYLQEEQSLMWGFQIIQSGGQAIKAIISNLDSQIFPKFTTDKTSFEIDEDFTAALHGNSKMLLLMNKKTQYISFAHIDDEYNII